MDFDLSRRRLFLRLPLPNSDGPDRINGGAFYLLYHFQSSAKRFGKALLDIKEESQVMYYFPGEAFEAAVCMVLIRGQFPAFSFRQALEGTFLGVFANVSTLFAGVVPMQSWYLCRQGMLAGSGAGVMTMEYALSHKRLLVPRSRKREIFPHT